MQRVLFVSVCVLGLVAGGFTQQPAATQQVSKEWLESPYQLTVQLHVQDHPLMTPAFVKGLERELADTLQSDLSKVCQVEVTSQKSQTMEEIVNKGWGELDKKAHAIDDKKTHYVRIIYHEGGQYEIQSRQEDGYTGTVTPLRKARTSDRLWVARQAALMIAQDFGMVGTVTESVNQVVRVKLKGANLAQPDSIRLHAGEVLALIKLRPSRDGRFTGQPLEGVTLYVTSVQGADNVTTQLFSRFGDPELKKKREKEQFRVVKLGTRWAPLNLRVVDRENRQPLAGVGVSVSSGGEYKKAEPIGATDAQGRVHSKQIYRNVAFVVLTQPGRNPVEMALPLLDDQYVDCFLAGNQLAERRAEFEYHLRALRRHTDESFVILSGESKSIRELLTKQKEQEALDVAKKLSAKLADDLLVLRNELETLINTHAAPAGDAFVQAANRERVVIDSLASKKDQVDELIKDLEDPSPASRKLREARDFEEQGEPAKAIEAYQEVIKLDPNRAKVKERVDELKKVWNIKAPELDKARTFVFDTWPGIDPETLDEHEKELDDALKALEKHGDHLSGLRLFKANLAHREKLNTARSGLNPDTKEDDQERATRIDKISDMIGKYNKRILELLERAK